MSAIERIRAELEKHPECATSEGDGWFSASPSGNASFEVTIMEHDGRYAVHFAGWHEDVASEAEALDLFFMGLSDAVRLRVASHGGADDRWTLEIRSGDGWREGSTTGLIFFRFWRPKKIRYLQNTIMERPRGGEGAA